MKYVLALLLTLAYFCGGEAGATCTEQQENDQGEYIVWTGSCTDDHEVLISTGPVDDFDACFLMSTTGAVDVFVSLDGDNYSTAALSLIDNGATDTNPVLVTAADRVYSFASKFVRIRVQQNGAPDAAASLLCFNYE